MAKSGKRPQKRRVEGGGRVTPKGGGAAPKRSKPASSGAHSESGRYTPPIPASYRQSPVWVPVLMFVLFGIGMLVIFLHYVDLVLPGASSNWWLFAGLAAILAGIIAATQYH